MLVSVGFFAVLITVFNFMAFQLSRKAPMRYVLEFFTVILPHPTKFCQYFILLIENFNLYSDEDGVKHIRIKARPNKWHENDCPFCHKSCPAYDKHSSRPTTWRGLDWGGILVEVEYQTHRIICLEHGVYVAEVPWAYPGSILCCYICYLRFESGCRQPVEPCAFRTSTNRH